jgi:peptidoglycan/LPS O-acetylase OafA/YrhL
LATVVHKPLLEDKRIYFPNLNGLRFIAALLVIIHHTEQIKSISNLSNYYSEYSSIRLLGKLGVVLFFVLSGFLITYLLLTEERKYNRVSIRKFYLRRVLRIWPLYFLIILCAFFVLPFLGVFDLPGHDSASLYSNLSGKLLLYALILPNLALSVYGSIPYASHSWSIGTEEQYYLVWPLVLRVVKKYRARLMVLIVVLYIAVEKFLVSPLAGAVPYSRLMASFWAAFNIDCMAIGALFAILLFRESSLLSILLNRFTFNCCVFLTGILLVAGVTFPYANYECYSVLFGVIILNLGANKNLRISLEHKLLNYLGTTSYGIYMFHPVGIVLALFICAKLGFVTNWVLYPVTLLLSVGIAGVSYKYYESFFLKFKGRFTKVLSGREQAGPLMPS